jgi:hypothetical protein
MFKVDNKNLLVNTQSNLNVTLQDSGDFQKQTIALHIGVN